MNELLELDILESKRVVIRKLGISDITDRYVNWLNDTRVNCFLSINKKNVNRQDVENYVKSFITNDTKFLLGIFDKTTKLHIGNITFTHIDWNNRSSAIGISIGDFFYQGKGYAIEALELSVDFIFSKLKFHKLVAGVNNRNKASMKLFEKVGFIKLKSLEEKQKYEIGETSTTLFVLYNYKICKN